VAQRVNRLDEKQRHEMSGYIQILAGLKFEQALVRQVFRKDTMQESVIYQEILEEGRQKGERSLIFRQLTRQVGELPEELRSRIETLSLEQLENLGEALLEFEAIADLEAWFDELE
jgi:predicted transposase YdaD